MIYDNLTNINTYIGLSESIREALVFLQSVDLNIKNGNYVLSSKVKAFVSEYDTKEGNNNGYETHKKYIDIQYVLNGIEIINYLPLDKLTVRIPYNSDNDIAFYTSSLQPNELMIGDGFFTILFPQDGHMPQLCVDKPQRVKKIVLKIEL